MSSGEHCLQHSICIMAIRAGFDDPLRNEEKENGSNISISVLSSTE